MRIRDALNVELLDLDVQWDGPEAQDFGARRGRMIENHFREEFLGDGIGKGFDAQDTASESLVRPRAQSDAGGQIGSEAIRFKLVEAELNPVHFPSRELIEACRSAGTEKAHGKRWKCPASADFFADA